MFKKVKECSDSDEEPSTCFYRKLPNYKSKKYSVSSAFSRHTKDMDEGIRCSSCSDSKTDSEESGGGHRMCMMPSLRPMFCNVCGDALQRVNLNKVTIYALACEICKLRTHKKCAPKASNTCKWSTLASMGKSIIEKEDGSLVMPHQWMPGNFAVNCKCMVCERSCGSILRIQDLCCLWCQATVHTGCREMTSVCDLGPASISILPPTHITNFDEGGFWRATKPPKSSPLLVFVNSKSGDNQGVKMLRKFKQLLNPAQVFDLIAGGTFKGLKLFQNFESFRVLVCGGDGSVAWVLNEIDQLRLHKQCQMGILPLGTGNDLSRVMGWGASFDDDTLLPAVLEKLETAQIQMFDRWSIMSYEVDRLQNRIIPLDPIGAYEDSAANHLSRIIYSESYNVVITSAMVLCGIVQELVSKVVTSVEKEGVDKLSEDEEEENINLERKSVDRKMSSLDEDDSLANKCLVLRDKMEALLITLAEESAAAQGSQLEVNLISGDQSDGVGGSEERDGASGSVGKKGSGNGDDVGIESDGSEGDKGCGFGVGSNGSFLKEVGSSGGKDAFFKDNKIDNEGLENYTNVSDCKEKIIISGFMDGIGGDENDAQTSEVEENKNVEDSTKIKDLKMSSPVSNVDPLTSPDSKAPKKSQSKDNNTNTLRSKEQLMNRANSLRKAIRNIVELTEKAVDEQNHQTDKFDDENKIKVDKTRKTKEPYDTFFNIKCTSATAIATSNQQLFDTSFYNSAASYTQTTAQVEVHNTTKTSHKHSKNGKTHNTNNNFNNNLNTYSSTSSCVVSIPPTTVISKQNYKDLTINTESNNNHFSSEQISDTRKPFPKPLTPIPFNYQLCELTPLSLPSTHAFITPTTTFSLLTSNNAPPTIPSNIFIFPVSPQRSQAETNNQTLELKIDYISVDKPSDKASSFTSLNPPDDTHQHFHFQQTHYDSSDAEGSSNSSTPDRLSPIFSHNRLHLPHYANHLSPSPPPHQLDMNLIGRWSPIFGMPCHQPTSPRFASVSPSFQVEEFPQLKERSSSTNTPNTATTSTTITTGIINTNKTPSTTMASHKKMNGRHVSSLSKLQQDNRIKGHGLGANKNNISKELHLNFPLLNLPLLQSLPSQQLRKRRKSSPIHSSLISRVLLANADALCAPISPFSQLQDISSEDFSEKCVMNNYFGIGLDAKISLDFHNKREEHPNKCRSRTKNKMWYGVLGTKEVLQRTHKNLDQKVRLECDGKLIPLPNLQGIVVLNIPSYMGGINFWGGCKEDEYFLAPSSDDKILEVVAVFGCIQLGISRVFNLQKHRIAQCKSVRITIIGDEGIPVQVDGEAWIQNPGVIWIRHKNRAQLLTRDRAFEEALKNWKRTEAEKKEKLNLASVREWTSTDVDKWLASIDLDTYSNTFRKHEIHGVELVNLKRNDLKDLNISKVGHVKKLLREIKILKGLSKHCINHLPTTLSTSKRHTNIQRHNTNSQKNTFEQMNFLKSSLSIHNTPQDFMQMSALSPPLPVLAGTTNFLQPSSVRRSTISHSTMLVSEVRNSSTNIDLKISHLESSNIKCSNLFTQSSQTLSVSSSTNPILSPTFSIAPSTIPSSTYPSLFTTHSSSSTFHPSYCTSTLVPSSLSMLHDNRSYRLLPAFPKLQNKPD